MNYPIHTLSDAQCFGFKFLLNQITTDAEADKEASHKSQ
jgi:hypothetical protein